LLTRDYVIKQSLEYASRNDIPLNSLEGFIRQVIGWREFMRGVYRFRGDKIAGVNFWKNSNHLSNAFYNGSTGIEPVDFVLKKVWHNAYAHHIERLMILGNFMLLCEIHPDEVYKWFMEMFIDSYDWVMLANVNAMSQYADGGGIVTKPYISSSNYVKKMSDFSNGPWCDVWDALYWRFIYNHRKVFEKNPRMKVMLAHLDRKGQAGLGKDLNLANGYLGELKSGKHQLEMNL